MDMIFPSKTSAFRNRAAVISFYLLLSELIKNKLPLDTRFKNSLREFYINFQQQLKNEVEKGADAEDAELIVYQSKVNQAADSKDSISKRHQILVKRLSMFNSEFRKYLNLQDRDEEVINLQKKDTMKRLVDELMNSIHLINKSYSVKKDGDLFKITNNVLKCVSIISVPVTSRQEFKNFIDSMYKIIYEGSGSLRRVPKEFIEDSSIFFIIKYLRNDFFHDMEHGDGSEVEKKKKELFQFIKNMCSQKH